MLFVASLVPWCATSTSVGQCANLAHRYCCFTLDDWRIPCGVPGGYCEGVVPPPPTGVNEFAPTLIPAEATGAMTLGSFRDVGDFFCVWHPPECWEVEYAPGWQCAVSMSPVEDVCDEYERKSIWSWCEDPPE